MIHSFTFERDLVRRFVRFGARTAGDDPRRIPASSAKTIEQLSPGYRFYGYGRIRNFLAVAGKQETARVSAIINPRMGGNTEPVGLLGFFEAVSAAEAREVIAAALDYLHSEGIPMVYGPVNFSTWDAYRFLTKGFDHDPFPGEPTNPPEYPAYFQQFGFFRVRRYFSAFVEDPFPLIDSYRGILERFEAAGYSTRPLDPRRRRADCALILRLAHQAFRRSWGFSPTSTAEFLQLHADFFRVIDPQYVRFAYDAAGNPAGFVVTYPSFFRALQQTKGRSDWLSKLRFLRGMHSTQTLVVKTLAATPGLRKAVVGRALLGLAYQTGVVKGMKHVIHALMAEGNPTLRMNPLADTSYKEYAVYGYRP
jgi:hypothetical protein